MANVMMGLTIQNEMQVLALIQNASLYPCPLLSCIVNDELNKKTNHYSRYILSKSPNHMIATVVCVFLSEKDIPCLST